MEQLEILVISCDKFSTFWDIFFDRFRRFWPECPYKIYLLNNQLNYINKGINLINIGEDKDWSTNLINALKKITAKNVLLITEDCPLDSEISQKEFEKIFNLFLEKKMKFLNLKSCPKPPKEKNDQIYTRIPEGAYYRVAVMPNIWDVETLKKLLIPGESAWQFELNGSVRSDEFSEFYVLKSQFISYLHCVIQGNLDLRAVQKLKKNNELTKIDFPVMSLKSFAFQVFKELRNKVFLSLVPYSSRRFFRNNLKKKPGTKSL